MAATLEHQLARRRMARRVDAVLPLEFSKETPVLAAKPAPIGKPGGPGLWRVKGMGFPPYFQNVRNALIRNGHTVAEASRITWAAIRRWAAGRTTGGEKGKIHPEVRAAARAALAGIAADAARAHAQHGSRTRAHANIYDQLILREFAQSCRVLNLANPYHSSSGQFTSAGNQGSAQPKQNAQTQKSGKQNKPPISAKQKAYYLQQAANAHAQAQRLRAEAAKLNQQIAALTALIAQEQKYLATSASGATNKGAGTQTGSGSGTQTATGAGTQAQSAQQVAQQAQQIIPGAQLLSPAQQRQAIQTKPTMQQQLAQNQAQLKQLTAQRTKLLQQASQLDQQAAHYTQLANG